MHSKNVLVCCCQTIGRKLEYDYHYESNKYLKEIYYSSIIILFKLVYK
jgi:hypothetical protein